MQDTTYWIEQVPFFCTMLATTSLLGIPHPNEYFRKKGQFKWPSLDELHAFLFGCEIEGRDNFHDALVDVKGTAKCYFWINKWARQKPKPSDFGYDNDIMAGQSGWMMEGGEEAFNAALKIYEFYAA